MTRTELNNIIAAILKLRETATDEVALESVAIYPLWKSEVEYKVGDRVRYNDNLYRCILDHTSQQTWVPTAAPTLFEAVARPGEDGTLSNPITYVTGMELQQDKYYVQNDIIYHCTRSTGVPVYNTLHDLINIYVETV